MSAEKQPQGRRPPASVAEAAERLAAIVEAAERAAAGVIDDAERQARSRLEEAGARADRIVAERLRALADELDPPGPDERRAPHLKPVEAVPAPGGQPPAPRRSGAGARLLATQMAVSGKSREEIDSRLRSDFGIGDPSEILDAILGPED
jgi:cell division septum initiation protein DivIVA